MKGCNSLNVFDVFFTNIIFVLELFFQNQFPLSRKKKKRHGTKCIQIRLAKTLGCGSLPMSNQGNILFYYHDFCGYSIMLNKPSTKHLHKFGICKKSCFIVLLLHTKYPLFACRIIGLRKETY